MSDSAGQSDSGLAQFHEAFFEEAHENLAVFEMTILAIGQDLSLLDDETLNSLFRCAHSIKGGAAAFGFSEITDFSHVMESLLDGLRRREIAPRIEMLDVLLESSDALKGLLQARRESRPAPSFDPLVAVLSRLASGQPIGEPDSGDSSGAASESSVWDIELSGVEDASAVDNLIELFTEIPDLGTAAALEPDAATGSKRFRVFTDSSESDLLDLFSFHVSRENIVMTRVVGEAAAAANREAMSSRQAAVTSAADRSRGASMASDEAGSAGRVSAARSGRNVAAKFESQTLRVRVDRIDQLVNLVGELVISQSILSKAVTDACDGRVTFRLAEVLRDMDRNMRSMQASVMAIRMVPVSVVFSRFTRLVRDLSAQLGKSAVLVTHGDGTELDKGMIERITDPLTHIIRNALDHGIEPPEERVKAGKPSTGTVSVSAEHRGGAIAIEVRDDGRGMSRARLLAKARDRGLPVSDEMTDREVWGLIFSAGFSTAESVTDISGRGVGMDVVRKNILSLGGSVDVESVEGQGTRLLIRIPLTMAIMDGMVVRVGSETYVVPLAPVVQAEQFDPARQKTIAARNRFVETRGQLVPVVRLGDVLGVPNYVALERPMLVTVEVEAGMVALEVDAVLGQQQIVVKDVGHGKVECVSGATILGDGRVALILDVNAFSSVHATARPDGSHRVDAGPSEQSRESLIGAAA
jgi:two-component system chemotaxis sensor kinase CheA